MSKTIGKTIGIIPFPTPLHIYSWLDLQFPNQSKDLHCVDQGKDLPFVDESKDLHDQSKDR